MPLGPLQRTQDFMGLARVHVPPGGTIGSNRNFGNVPPRGTKDRKRCKESIFSHSLSSVEVMKTKAIGFMQTVTVVR